MRTIKFRAWDKTHKEMSKLNEFFRISARNGAVITDIDTENDYDYILMQFTGLKDKKGKEIYEGDIVRFLYTDWPSKDDADPRTLEQYLISISYVGFVEYKTPEFMVNLNGYYKDFNIGKYGYIEIIGNIYENPELITNSKTL